MRPLSLDKRIVESLWPDKRAKLGCLVIGVFFALLFVPPVVSILAIMNSSSVPPVIELWVFPGWLIAVVSWGSAVMFGYGVQGIKHFGWRRAGLFRLFAPSGLGLAGLLLPHFWHGHPLILVVPSVIMGSVLGVAWVALAGSGGSYWVYLEARVHGKDPFADLGPEGSPLRKLYSVRNLLKVYAVLFLPFAVALALGLVIHFSNWFRVH